MKVAVVGAGISGLYLAAKLKELGNEVTVFEKKSEVGNNVCSGLFSERILKFFPESQKIIQNRIKSVKIRFPKKTITVSFTKEFLIMSHSELDKLAAKKAERCGVKLIFDKNIDSLPPGFNRIIGCDGPLSLVREKMLNLDNPFYRIGIQGFVKENNKSDWVEVWPVKKGFIWKIPRGDETEYGIIANPISAPLVFRKFLNKNNISIGKIKSKIIPQGLIIPSDSSVTLCGDAAGMTKPWSGGGVIWGLTAADMLIKTFPDFSEYKKEADRFFKVKIFLSKTAVKAVYFLGFNFPWVLPSKAKIESDFLF